MITPGTTFIFSPKCALRMSDPSVFTIRSPPCIQNTSARSESLSRILDKCFITAEWPQLRVRSTISLASFAPNKRLGVQSKRPVISPFTASVIGTRIIPVSGCRARSSRTDLIIKIIVNLAFNTYFTHKSKSRFLSIFRYTLSNSESTR